MKRRYIATIATAATAGLVLPSTAFADHDDISVQAEMTASDSDDETREVKAEFKSTAADEDNEDAARHRLRLDVQDSTMADQTVAITARSGDDEWTWELELDEDGRGRLELRTDDGDEAPALMSGDEVEVMIDGESVFSGVFDGDDVDAAEEDAADEEAGDGEEE